MLACGVLTLAAPLRAAPEAGPAPALPKSAAAAVAALRAGRASLAKGAPAAAARAFAKAAAREPAIAAAARRLEAQALLDAHHPGRAAAAARAGLQAKGGSAALRVALLTLLGRAEQDRGHEAEARAAWNDALALDPAPERAAALRAELAQSFERSGDLEAAARTWRRLWVDTPAQPEARLAAQRLDFLEIRLGRPLRGPADHLRRADRLFEAQHSEAAFADYDVALAGGLPETDRAHAAERRAHCLFRLRRYPEAEAAFGARGSDPEARLWQARARARAGDEEGAIAALEALGRESHGATSAWARELAGLLHAGRDEQDAARALFASVAADPAASESVAGEALWRLAWTAYTEGDRGEARRRFQALAARQHDPLEALAARYWAARSLGPDEAARAHAELAAIAREFPFTYYGWRAAGQATPGAHAAADPAAPPSVSAGRAALDDADLLAARILVAAGATDSARDELAALDARAAGLADRLAVGRLHAAAGDWAGAQQLVVAAYADRLARGPVPGQEALWRLAWPAAYPDALHDALPPDARVDRALVAAVMREESGFRSDAVSVTGALGLLQVMPATGARLAHDAGLGGFTPAALLDPRTNLRLGGLYLDRLSRRFDGALAPLVASYNAGPEAVGSWLGKSAGAEDEWVESIPYAETRGYVKRVLRSRYAYETLYP
jgi:soluble lytic murein transglycosylase